ncbi:hypothetical protein T492DRAFT_891129 [Pavlovales sp. CCMP2436]|nr:hypothetical protein T492DRAFT_891129 [Pavlovales sp. CCMP2436]
MYTVLRPYARKFANAYAQKAEVNAVRVIDSADVTNLLVRTKAVLSDNVCTTSATADGTEAVAYFNYASLANRATPNGLSDAYSTGTYTIPVLSYPLNPVNYDSATCYLQDSLGLLTSTALGGLAVQFDYTYDMSGCVVTIGDPNIPATPTATIQRAYAVSMDYATAYQSLVPYGGAMVTLQAFGPGLEPVCYVGFVLMERLVVIQAGQRDNWPLMQLYAPAKAGVLCRLGAVPASTRGANSQNMRPCTFNQLRVRTTGKEGARLTPALVFASAHASRLAPDVLLGDKAEMGSDLVVRGAATFGMTVHLPTLTYLNGTLLEPPVTPISIAITGCTASDSWLVQTDNTGSAFQVLATAAHDPILVQTAIQYPSTVVIESFTLFNAANVRNFNLAGSINDTSFATVQSYSRTMSAGGMPVSTAGLAQNWDVNLCLIKGGQIANNGLYRFAPGASGSLGNMYTVLRPYARKFANTYAQEAEVNAVRVIDSADVTNLVVRSKTDLSGTVLMRGAASFGAAKFSGATTFEGLAEFFGPTTIMGPADLMDDLLVRGASTFNGKVEMMGDLLVRGAAFLPALTYMNGTLLEPAVTPVSIAITGCTASDSWLVQTDNTGSAFQVQATAVFNPFTAGNADAMCKWELTSQRGPVSLVSAEPTSLNTFKLVLTDPQGVSVSPAGIAQNWDINLCLTKDGKVANNGLYRFAPGASGSLGTAEEFISFMGGGTPTKRAAILATAATAICYATKTPAIFFTEKGGIKQFHPDPEGSDEPENKTQLHFVIVPILAACVGYLFL